MLLIASSWNYSVKDGPEVENPMRITLPESQPRANVTAVEVVDGSVKENVPKG